MTILVVVAAAVAACSSIGSTASTIAPGSAATSTTSPPTPAISAGSSFAAFRDAFCGAWTSVFTATGNPDTGSGSELSIALDVAIQNGDAPAITELSGRMRAELERGRTNAASGLGWAPGAGVLKETDRFILALEAGLDALVRDAGRGKQAAKATSQAAFEAAGGLEAWYGMSEAAAPMASARPRNEPPYRCPSIPMSI